MVETTVFGEEQRTFQPLFTDPEHTHTPYGSWDADPEVILKDFINKINTEKPIELPDEWFQIDL